MKNNAKNYSKDWEKKWMEKISLHFLLSHNEVIYGVNKQCSLSARKRNNQEGK